MILQLGSIFAGLGSFLTTAIGGLAKQAIPIATDFGAALLRKELARVTQRSRRSELRGAIRERSNFVGQGPAVPGQGPVPTGGRTFLPPGLVANIVPPGITGLTQRFVGSRPPASVRRASLQAKQGLPLRQRVMEGIGQVRGLLPLPPPTFRSFMRGRPAAMANGEFNGGAGVDFATGRVFAGAGAATGSRFQRTADNCSVQHFVVDATTGQLQPIEFVVDPEGKARYRLDLVEGIFKKIKPRRMNPLNFKALGRARRRAGAALRVCRTMFTEARREKTGKVRPKRRSKRK